MNASWASSHNSPNRSVARRIWSAGDGNNGVPTTRPDWNLRNVCARCVTWQMSDSISSAFPVVSRCDACNLSAIPGIRSCMGS